MMIGEGEVRKASVTAATKCRLSEVTREQLLGTVSSALDLTPAHTLI